MGSVYYGRESNENKFLPLSGGTMTGDTSMGLWRLHGLAAPVDESGAVSKRYMDDQVRQKINAHHGEHYRLQSTGAWDYSSNGGRPIATRASHSWVPAGPLSIDSMFRFVSHSFDFDTKVADDKVVTYKLRFTTSASTAILTNSYTVSIGKAHSLTGSTGFQLFFPDFDDVVVKDILPNENQYPAAAWIESWKTGSSENKITFSVFEKGA